MDCSPSSSSVYEISQARIPAWIAISCSRRSFWPRDWTCVSYIPWIGRQILYHEWLLGSGKLFVTLLFMFPVLENNFFSSSLQTLIIGLTHGAFGEGNGTPLQCSCLEIPMGTGAWWAVVHGVAKSWTWLSDFTFTFHFWALEEEMATHSSVFAWRIPGTAAPGGPPSMGSHTVRHDWSDLAAAAAAAAAAWSFNPLPPVCRFSATLDLDQWGKTVYERMETKQNSV